MRSTLFHIPAEVAGLPVFGYGLLLALWAVASVALLAWLVRRQGFNADTRGYLPVLVVMGLVIAYLLPAISDRQGLPIRGYGIMLLVAVVSGVALAMYRARRMGVDPELIMSLAFWIFVGGIVGGRMFFVIEYWDRDFSPSAVARQMKNVPLDPRDIGDKSAASPAIESRPAPSSSSAIRGSIGRILRLDTGGLVIYGALLVGGLFVVIFIRKYHVPGLALTDLIAPSVVLGLGIGRLGCFLNGCCFGGPCDLPWAVTFPAGSPPHEQQIRLGQVYGLLIVGDAEHRPVIGIVEAYTPAAGVGLKAGDLILSIDGHNTAKLDDAQEELRAAFAPDRALELTTARGIHRLQPMPGTYEHSRPVHPTQLYSAIDAFILCAFLLAYYPYRRRDGEVTALTLSIHPITRFLLEVIRTDEGPVFGTGLSISQNISLLILGGAIVLWIYLSRQPRGSVWPPTADT